jgi:tetratricopeptide (TPR) repeat protein
MMSATIRRGGLFASLTAVIAAVPAWAAPALVTASIEPTQITLGESAQLTITRSGGSNEPLSLPTVEGLSMRVIGTSQRTEIIRGATFSTTALVVRVTASAAGVYTIPAITPQTQPLVLRVRPEGSLPLPGQLGSTGAKASDLSKAAQGAAFLRLVLAKKEIYVGESIPVAIELGLKNGYVKSLNGLPILNGADFTMNNLSRQPERTEKVIDGEGYTILTWHSVLGGVKAGHFSLSVESPVTIRIQNRPPGESRLENMLGDPFMQKLFGATVTKEVTVKSAAAELAVLELPNTGRPADFSGAVGSFKIADEVSTISASAGDPLTVRLHVTGTGNFDRVDSAMFSHLDGWKTYPPQSSFKASDELGYKGEKTFEQPIVAANPGNQTLPQLAFSYFDPETRRYEMARSAPLHVTIAASPAARSLGNPAAAEAPRSAGLRPDHSGAGTLYGSLVPLYLRPGYLTLSSLLTLGLAGGWLGLQRAAQQTLAQRRRRHRAAKAMERRLRELEALARAGNVAQFLSRARAALALPAGSDPADESDAVRELIALADETNYAGNPAQAVDFERWLGLLRERLTREQGSAVRGVASLILLTALILHPGAQALASDSAPRPTDHFSATALYNLANAYARANQPALAILNYERAALLAPDDPDIEANLAFVRASAHQPSPSRSRLTRAAQALDPTLTAWLGLMGLLGVGASLLARSRSPRYPVLRGLGSTGGLALIAWTVTSAAVSWPNVHAAVVITDAAPVRVSPVPMGDPVFTLPLAETVQITATHDDFLLIRTRTGKTGWAARTQVIPVVAAQF